MACKVSIYSGNRDISISRRAKLTFIPVIEISLLRNRDISISNRDISITNRDISIRNRDISIINRDIYIRNANFARHREG